MTGPNRVFVRGVSRSGGTLMATILDAHPDVAMGYEVYEHLLDPGALGDAGVLSEIRNAVQKRLAPPRDIAAIGSQLVRRFANRLLRNGTSLEELYEALNAHLKGDTLTTFDGRSHFVDGLLRRKSASAGKTRWGSKIAGKVPLLHDLFPDSVFLFMLRDGRDIAASRKQVGEFEGTVEENAASWSNQVEQFVRFATKPGVRAMLVRYERLVTEPEAYLREIADLCGLRWHENLLRHAQQDLSLFRNPVGHLSVEQVRKPITDEAVGRWRRDLSSEEVAAFETVAGATLQAHGYGLSFERAS
ncbi:MAG: sulfotransferase [Chloroflexi bacterium]|nr:sulfotransferase [Chloroflexota bacterium]